MFELYTEINMHQDQKSKPGKKGIQMSLCMKKCRYSQKEGDVYEFI